MLRKQLASRQQIIANRREQEAREERHEAHQAQVSVEHVPLHAHVMALHIL